MKFGGIRSSSRERLRVRIDHEELILRNPALGACAFWHLSRKYAEGSAGSSPTLPHFVLAAGLLFHRSTVEKLRRMQFDSGILRAVVERPEIIAGLQGRIEQCAPPALLALHVGAATGIFCREGGDGFPSFRALGHDLPKPVRDGDAIVMDTFGAARRLGAWFAMDDLLSLTRQLSVEF